MKKDFIVSKIEAPQDGSPYVFVTFTDPDSKDGNSSPQSSFSSSEDLMKNLPKAMSNMFGASGGMPGDSPTFTITMREYEEMAIKVGDRVGIEVKKVDRQQWSLKDNLFPLFLLRFSTISLVFACKRRSVLYSY